MRVVCGGRGRGGGGGGAPTRPPPGPAPLAARGGRRGERNLSLKKTKKNRNAELHKWRLVFIHHGMVPGHGTEVSQFFLPYWMELGAFMRTYE